jgi:hypothetical protein
MRIRIRLGVLVGSMIAAALVAGYALAASVGPDAFTQQGVTRYAMVASDGGSGGNATTASTTYVDMPGMATSISVPTGKTADVIVAFSGMANTCSALYVRAVIDSAVASPAEVQFMWNLSGGAESHAFTFFGKAKSGAHTVKVQWKGLSCASGQQFMAARSMIVTANVH